MVFILPGILIVGFLALAVWWLFFRSALRQERTVQAARQREADFERLLATPGETLFCVACQDIFPGPLDTEGCPTCHTQAFVIPARTSDDPRIAAKKCPPPVSPEGGTTEILQGPAAVPVRESVLSSPPPAEATVEQRIAKK